MGNGSTLKLAGLFFLNIAGVFSTSRFVL